ESEVLTLRRHLFGARPRLGFSETKRRLGVILAAEKASLSALALPHGGLGDRQQHVGISEDFGPVRLDAVERARPCETFELASIHGPRRHAPEHFLQALELTARGPFGDDLLHRSLAYVADSGQSIAHGMPVLGLLDGEFGF